MKTGVGLWIDHRKAIIVVVTEEGEEIRQILSLAEKKPRRSGDSPLKGFYAARQVPAEDSSQRIFTGLLNSYYDEIITDIRDAESILIFGPGEAKNELKTRLETNNLSERLVGLETADKMTNRQIAAKVRRHFAE
ncbi:MAG: hypothetical protein WC256_11905 [Desulfurivibrionaceae bacterium]|jgi:hypothetical protein